MSGFSAEPFAALPVPRVGIRRVPWITAAQMRIVDRWMEREYNIELLQMMENAGRQLARLTRMMFPEPAEGSIAVAAGSGGNGGGALAAARRLLNWGYRVAVHLVTPWEKLSAVPQRQADILRRMGAFKPDIAGGPILCWLDGIIGYSLRGAPRDDAARWIERMNNDSAPIISLDLPSGLDPDGLTNLEPRVRATATLTLALPKTGLLDPELMRPKPEVGRLYLADIGVPPQLYREALELEVGNLFAEDDLVEIV